MPWKHPLRGNAGDQTAADSDQTAADSDQTTADADQEASDSDQTTSDRDRDLAQADQRASARDQVAADLDLASVAHPDAARRHEHEHTRSEREESTLERKATALIRGHVSKERDAEGRRRDEIAVARDLVAEDRDRVAEQRDVEFVELAKQLDNGDSAPTSTLEVAATMRAKAAEDRRRAAVDRLRAAEDRELAASDRQLYEDELERAHVDQLTGAYGRGIGEVIMRHEIERARRSKQDLVLVYMDVDGLKAVNDSEGHAAGDELLSDAVDAFRSRLRPYDPIVRWGGDEFICMFCAPSEDAGARLDEARKVLAGTQPNASITLGVASMQEGDTLESLMERADHALLDTRRAN